MFKIITVIQYGIRSQLLLCPSTPVECNTLISVRVVWFSAAQLTAKWAAYVNP